MVYPTFFLWCSPLCVDMLFCAICTEYETFHTDLLLPKMNKNISKVVRLYIFKKKVLSTRNVHKTNLISKAYLLFTVYLHHSGKFHASSMIKGVLDPKHVAIPSKVVPFININPIPFVGYNLFQGIMVYKINHSRLSK